MSNPGIDIYPRTTTGDPVRTVTAALVAALIGWGRRRATAARHLGWRLLDDRALWRGLAIVATHAVPALVSVAVAASWGAQTAPAGPFPLVVLPVVWLAARSVRRRLCR